ncbi:MAG: hypothetical protein Q9223_003004 [Gallowayella weberi]
MSSPSSVNKRQVSRPHSPAPKRIQSSTVDAQGLPLPSSSAAEPMMHDQPATSKDSNHIGNGTDTQPWSESPFPISKSISVAGNGDIPIANRGPPKKRRANPRSVREGKKADRYPVDFSWPQLSKEAERQVDEVGTPGPSSPSRQHRQQVPRQTSQRLPKVDQFDKTFSSTPQNELEREAEEERNKRFKLGRPSPFSINDPSPERPSAGSSRERPFDEIENSVMSSEDSSNLSSPFGSSESSGGWLPHRIYLSKLQLPPRPLDLASSAFPPEVLPDFGTLSTSNAPFSHEGVASDFANAEGTGLPQRNFSYDADANCRKRGRSALDGPGSRYRAAESEEESRSSEESYTQAKRSQTSMWVSSLSASSFSTDTADVTGECRSKTKRELSEAQHTDINSWSDGEAGTGKKQVQDRPQSSHDKSSEAVDIGLTTDGAIHAPAAYDGSHVSKHGTGPWSIVAPVAIKFRERWLARVFDRARETSEVSAGSSLTDPSF